MKPRALTIALCLLTGGCSGYGDDLDAVCAVAAEVRADEALSPAERPDEVLARWEPSSSDGQTAKNAVRHAEPAFMHDLLVASAEQEGVGSWSCEPLRQISEQAAGE